MAVFFRAMRLILLGAVLAAVLFAGGFVLFARVIERDAGPPPRAEGIVALTGGKDRIGEAVELLAGGRAKRLLITGVNPSTRRSELQALVPRGDEFFPCCVDLGRTALDTRGNAAETVAWVGKHGFTSLIVVTSAYHMPRTLIEFARVMPDVELTPYPVVSANSRIERWWSHGHTRRLVLLEYVKYLGALAQYAAVRLAQSIGVDANGRLLPAQG